MKAVLLGLDFLDLDNEIKFLEMNTDAYIPHAAFDSFDFNALETYLVTSQFSKFRIIYKFEYAATEFIAKLQNICDLNNIIFEEVVVAVDAITVPSYDDIDTEFTLRISYDITALVDDVYCRDKKELLSLIFDNNETNLIPKTYFQKDGKVYDNISNIIDNGIHPNLIIKKSLPDFEKTSFPEFHKISTETELADIKQTIAEPLITQEFVFNPNNLNNGKIRDHIRQWIILCSDTTTIIDFGAYVSSNALPLNPAYISYTDTKLDEESRILYFSNPSRVGVGIPTTYETIKIENNTEITTTLNNIVIGDTVKAINLPGLNDTAGVQGTMNWVYTGSYTDIQYTTASVIVKLTESVDEWFIKVNYDINSEAGSMLVNLVELVLTCDSTGSNLTFKSASDLTSDDYIVISNTLYANVTSIQYEKFVGDVVKLNIEPADVFLAGSVTNGIGQTIANNFIIYNYKS